ncbi:methyl-accepting chemotaxis protein [Paenibacillus sp. TRM 82003]|nr:methyl-accepting chemotaxis protein [Paenibacillus sp. TRM 82003]
MKKQKSIYNDKCHSIMEALKYIATEGLQLASMILTALGFGSLTGKFLLLTGTTLLVLFGGLFVHRFQEVAKPIEAQFMEEGKVLAISMAKSLESITETDLRNGVMLSDGSFIGGAELEKKLFNDELTLMPGSEQEAQKRLADTQYQEAKQPIFDGTSVPLSEYELKYTSDFDAYTDERWQGVIDSYVTGDSVVFAIPAFFSTNPEVAGYVATHNTIYSPTGEASVDTWGTQGLLSQKYRANRVFNDATGYAAAANTNRDEPLIQVYPRLVEGKVVTMWDISYPIFLNEKHWGGVRVAMSKEKADATIGQQREQILQQYIIMFVSVMVLLFVLTRVLVQRRVRALTNTANAMFASGYLDLTKRFDDRGKDEISSLSAVLNGLVDHLKQLVVCIQSMSNDLHGSSTALSESVVRTRQAADRFQHTIHEVSSGADLQAQGAKESATAMMEMALGVQTIAEASNQVALHSKDIVTQIEQGNRDTQRVNVQMNDLRATTDQAMSIIQKLSELSKNIGSFATVITNISNQTNILSLNASIEASRAGEQGKGFNVIAGEIRKLSMQTQDSSIKITGMIQEIQNFTDTAVASMKTNNEEVQKSVSLLSRVGGSLEEMLRAMQSVDDNIQGVSATSEELSAGVEQTTASVDEISGIAAEASQSIRQAVESYKEQIAVIERISTSAVELGEVADRLQKEVKQFKIV